MMRSSYPAFVQAGDEHSHRRDPIAEMSSLVVTESSIGGVISVGLFLIVWTALPDIQPYLAATLVCGGLFGLALRFCRR